MLNVFLNTIPDIKLISKVKIKLIKFGNFDI